MFLNILTLFCLCKSIVLCHEQDYDKETNLTKITYRFPVNKKNKNSRQLLNHFWKNFKWRKTTENLVVSVGDCHTTSNIDWPNMLTDVVYHWNHIPEKQDGTGKIYTPTNLTFVKTTCEGAMIKSFNDDYGDTGWYGECNIYYDDDNYILRATSQVNLYYSLNTRQWQQVLCHEIGHGVGIGHQSEDGSDLDTCMDYDIYNSNRYPNKHDVDILDVLYGNGTDADGPHVDSNEQNSYIFIVLGFLFVIICILITLTIYMSYKN